MSIRSAVVGALWKIEVLAERLRIQWSVSTDAPLSSAEAARAFRNVTHSGDGYPRLLFWSATDPPQNFI